MCIYIHAYYIFIHFYFLTINSDWQKMIDFSFIKKEKKNKSISHLFFNMNKPTPNFISILLAILRWVVCIRKIYAFVLNTAIISMKSNGRGSEFWWPRPSALLGYVKFATAELLAWRVEFGRPKCSQFFFLNVFIFYF